MLSFSDRYSDRNIFLALGYDFDCTSCEPSVVQICYCPIKLKNRWQPQWYNALESRFKKPDLRKNLELRKIVGATEFSVHKLFDLRKIF